MKIEKIYAPVLKILMPFAASTILAITLLNANILLVTSAILLSSAIGLFAYKYFYNRFSLRSSQLAATHKFSYRWINGAILLLVAVASGFVNVWLHSIDLRPDFFTNSLKPSDYILARVTVPLQDKGNTFRTIAKIDAVGNSTNMHSVEGKLLISFQKDSTKKLPGYGDLILIKNVIHPIKPAQFPGEFNMNQYMSYQGIYHSAFLKSGDWISMGKNAGNSVWEYIYRFDAQIKKQIRDALPNPEMSGIAEALIIGDETDIPNETITDYAGTGTIHILSVSGLHIGLILFGLNWIFSFLTRFPKGKYVRLVIVLIIIWAYAFLTGFSAPVARSVIMFTIVYIGINIGRRSNIYNSIGVSALILLLLDPFLIMQASFQLSYIALTGIVWLQPKIASFLTPAHKFTNYIWELAAASIAAQIITFPLTILYFNQFSVYFLPANLIVIPSSFVVLFSGILFVFASLVPILWVHHLFSWVLYACILCLNFIVRFFNHLPGATSQGLYISNWGVILLYLCIVLILTGIFYKKKTLLESGLVMAILFFGLRITDIFENANNIEMNVLSASPGHTVITLKDHKKLFILSDSGFINDPQLMKFHINGYAWENYVKPENIICINSEINPKFSEANTMVRGALIGFYNRAIMMINSKTQIAPLFSNQIHKDIDALVLSDNPNIRLSKLFQKFHFKSVIASSGDNITQIRQWETECIENNIPFVNLQNTGYINIPI